MTHPNTAIHPDGYVPVLKCKQGELKAIASAHADRLLPLVEMTDCDRAGALAAAWPHVGHAILAHPLNADGAEDADWAITLAQVFDELRLHGIEAVPVVTIDEGPATLAAVAAAAATDGRGVAVRLDAEDIALESAAALQADVDALLASLGLAPDSVDLVVDCGLVRDSIVGRVTTAEAALRVVPYLMYWRNLVTTFSAFPDLPGDVAAKGAVTPLPRDDASAYATLVGRAPGRTPTYGDYAVGVPTYSDVAWTPIPSIKYTVDAAWLMFRGTERANPSPQYRQLAADVCASADYRGAGFSPGDAYYSAVATGSVGPGNATKYVEANTAHHLAHVLDSLATHGVP
jgi:hypothetical protein